MFTRGHGGGGPAVAEVEPERDVVHKARMTTAFQRTPWPPDFPDVAVHMDLKTRNSHPV